MTQPQREIAWSYVLSVCEDFYPSFADRVILIHDALRDIGHTTNWQAISDVLDKGT